MFFHVKSQVVRLFIPGFLSVFHLCIITQLWRCAWSPVESSHFKTEHASFFVEPDPKLQGYMVAPYTIPCSYSLVGLMDKVYDSTFVGALVKTVVKPVNISMCSRTMLACLIGRRFVLDKCLLRSHGDSEICPLYISLNIFPNRDLPTTYNEHDADLQICFLWPCHIIN